jgi:hypothetical protein
MHISSSLNGALAADRERALRDKARDASSRPRARLPRRLRGTAPTN